MISRINKDSLIGVLRIIYKGGVGDNVYQSLDTSSIQVGFVVSPNACINGLVPVNRLQDQLTSC